MEFVLYQLFFNSFLVEIHIKIVGQFLKYFQLHHVYLHKKNNRHNI